MVEFERFLISAEQKQTKLPLSLGDPLPKKKRLKRCLTSVVTPSDELLLPSFRPSIISIYPC